MRKVLWGLSCGVLATLLVLSFDGGPTRGQRPTGSTGGKDKGRDDTGRQEPPEPALASIEEMVGQALKSNPDIRLAENKLRDDEADLARTRLRVMQRIIALHHALQAQRAEVDRDRAKVKRVGNLVRSNALQRSALEEAQQDLNRARSRYQELLAELPYLLGKSAQGLAEEAVRTEIQIGKRSRAEVIRGPMATRIRKALDRPIKVDYKEVTLKGLLRDLTSSAAGLPLQVNLALADLDEVKFGMRLGEVPLGSALLALQDTFPGLRVVARNYGILITWEHQVPFGAVRLFDFWKNAPK